MHEFKRTHLNFNCNDIGVVLFKKYPYLGASPDLIVKCTCCGKGVVETKCPSSIAGEKPSNKIIADWKLQRRVTADLKKTVHIFIKCTAKWQQLNQNTVIFV